ncbi:YXWGXW repeat-containing protein [Comamonas aquatilis]|uniref:YXWGXW repeat-containing protein n=1 Tax=Comamonas aquatilis TaxID=1778406 RepID=UPI0039F0F8FB
MLNIRYTFQTALGATALAMLGFAGTAQAQTGYGYGPGYHPAAQQGASINVQFNAPPAPRREAVPSPRRGYVWAPGYWEPRGHRHVWRTGHWVKARPGYVYRQPGWQQNGNRWNYNASRWDRDGDGVPNRYDQRPGNPYRH